MEFLTDVIISLLDLLEAEGRSLKKNVLRLGLAVALYIVAGVLLITGALLLLAGLHSILAARFGATAAHFATGGMTVTLAAIVFAVAVGIANKRESDVRGGGEDGRNEEEPAKGTGAGTRDSGGGGQGPLQAIDDRGQPRAADRQTPA